MEPGASKPTLKLCDWGFSKEVAAASGCKTRCGTPEYMAPEARFPLAMAFSLPDLACLDCGLRQRTGY